MEVVRLSHVIDIRTTTCSGHVESMSEKNDAEFPRQMLREESAAAILDVAPKTLRNWRSRGEGPPYRKLHGAGVRYWLDELLKWADVQQ